MGSRYELGIRERGYRHTSACQPDRQGTLAREGGKNIPANYTYITYAINQATRKIIEFAVGSRCTEVIAKVINKLLSLSPARIYTDKLNIYPGLIGQQIHSTGYRRTNHIERMNLTIRQHLKRLSRKTISFSKSIEMLRACFGLYVWG